MPLENYEELKHFLQGVEAYLVRHTFRNSRSKFYSRCKQDFFRVEELARMPEIAAIECCCNVGCYLIQFTIHRLTRTFLTVLKTKG